MGHFAFSKKKQELGLKDHFIDLVMLFDEVVSQGASFKRAARWYKFTRSIFGWPTPKFF